MLGVRRMIINVKKTKFLEKIRHHHKFVRQRVSEKKMKQRSNVDVKERARKDENKNN